MTDIRLLTLDDLWLLGDVLGGAMLAGWSGPVRDDTDCVSWLPSECSGIGVCACTLPPEGTPYCKTWFARDLRIDFRRPEVRDRAVRVVGPDLLPIHTAELRGEVTPGEAAGLVWCSVVRREAGLNSLQGWHGEWRRCGPAGVPVRHERWERGRSRRDLAPPTVTGTARQVLTYRNLADAAALAAGYALREPGGILLLPLPDGVVGRLGISA